MSAPAHLTHPPEDKPLPEKKGAPLPRRSRRIIDRTQKPLFILQQLRNFFLVPEMIPARNHIHARRKNLRRGPWRNPRTARRVFSIGNYYVDPMLQPKFRNQSRHSPAARLSHNIANEKNLHSFNSNPSPKNHDKARNRFRGGLHSFMPRPSQRNRAPFRGIIFEKLLWPF